MSTFLQLKGLFLVSLSAIVGASIFYSFAMGSLYLARLILANTQTEAAAPLWLWIYPIVILLGMLISAVAAGFWGYFRFCQPKLPDDKRIHKQYK